VSAVQHDLIDDIVISAAVCDVLPVVNQPLQLPFPAALQGSSISCATCAAGIGPEGKKKMSQWVTKTIKELLGEEEQTLVRAGSDVSFHVGRQPNAYKPVSR